MFTKANVQSGQNVFITGIGGGVAITALQYCVALGANVWVSSSSEDKIARAVALGAKGGVNYKDRMSSLVEFSSLTSDSANWAKTLATLLPASRPYLDAVVDSGGGPIVAQVTRVMKHGGVVACYGSTSGVDVQIGMGAILKNIEFKGASPTPLRAKLIRPGCTMGSLAEFKSAVAFIAKHQIQPVVHTVLPGLEHAEEGFEIMKRGGQFGKIVIHVEVDDKRKL